MKRIVVLLIVLPITSVIMSGITLYVALSEPDPTVVQEARSLSKTSWRETP